LALISISHSGKSDWVSRWNSWYCDPLHGVSVANWQNTPSNNIERLNNICDKFAWDVIHNHSYIFIFTPYKISNKLTCQSSDIYHFETYEYLCQYGLFIFFFFYY
jgi:hypothetical protein